MLLIADWTSTLLIIPRWLKLKPKRKLRCTIRGCPTLAVNTINPVYTIRSSIVRNPNLAFCVKPKFEKTEIAKTWKSTSMRENMSKLPWQQRPCHWARYQSSTSTAEWSTIACCPMCTCNSPPYFHAFYRHIKIVFDTGASFPWFLLILLKDQAWSDNTLCLTNRQNTNETSRRG